MNQKNEVIILECSDNAGEINETLKSNGLNASDIIHVERTPSRTEPLTGTRTTATVRLYCKKSSILEG